MIDNAPSNTYQGASRESASVVCRDRARRLREEANQWDALALLANTLEVGSLPEEALWHRAVRAER